MFDFDNDGDFDLEDIVETDIALGLFSEDECPHCGEFIENPNAKMCPFCGGKLFKMIK